MADLIKAPINYAVSAGGQFVKGGSVLFGFENIRPDEVNPATLKPIYLDSALLLEAANPQGLSSDAVFDQSDNGVLYGADADVYSVIIYDSNGVELSYIPSYDLSDANSALSAQDAADAALTAESGAQEAEINTALLYTDFINRFFGAFASDPALDDEGNPPNEGSLYWNTVNKTFKVFDTGAWYLPQDLGFGTAAEANVQTSPTDTTAEALMAVGAFGIGADTAPMITDLKSLVEGGLYSVGGSTLNLPPNMSNGSAYIGKWTTSGASESQSVLVIDISNDTIWLTNYDGYDGGTWSAWQPVYTGANYQPQELGGGLNVPQFMKNVSGTSWSSGTTKAGSGLQYAFAGSGGELLGSGGAADGTWLNINNTNPVNNQFVLAVKVAD